MRVERLLLALGVNRHRGHAVFLKPRESAQLASSSG